MHFNLLLRVVRNWHFCLPWVLCVVR